MFEQLKQKQSAMWGNGPYERITALLTEAQDDVVVALDPASGERWLDVATGTGAVARLIAQRGADVTGLDLSPALIETARGETEAANLSVHFDVGDAEALPYEDASFDGVVSTFGVMSLPITLRWRASWLASAVPGAASDSLPGVRRAASATSSA